MTDAHFAPTGPLRGQIVPPADKSISHRAAILGAMSEGPLRIVNYLRAADTDSTLDAMRALGATVDVAGSDVTIYGVGLHGARSTKLDVGNAGTLMRLLPGWLAGIAGAEHSFDGDDSIRRRPVDRIAAPLREMGARIDATDGRLPPFTVTGARLSGIRYELPVASAQVKSCILLAGLMAEGQTTIVEPMPSRDHTERMLAAAGAAIEQSGPEITVRPATALSLGDLQIPGDPSSAAFAIAAAAVVPGSRVLVRKSTLNWTRCGFVSIARRMGASITGELEERSHDGVFRPEPIGDLEVTQSPLKGTVITADEVPLAIDELPLVALLGCFAEGETVVTGAQELRVKESDRITTVVEGLRGLGAQIDATEDGFVVQGTGGLSGGHISSHGDHRLAMLGAIAGMASGDGVRVSGMEAAAVSYPTFEQDFAALAGGA